MPRISVVHVITTLLVGGAESMLAKLMETMDQTRFRQTVVVLLDKGKLGGRIERAGVEVIPLNMTNALQMPHAVLKLRAILKATKPDIIQTWLYHADLVGTIAARSVASAQLLWNIRCSNMEFGDYPMTTRLICKALAKLSSIPMEVISNSEAGKAAHTALGYHPRSWRILYNGFDTDRFRPDDARAHAFRSELGVARSDTLIGLPARLDPMKDHDTFLNAAAILAKDNPNVRFVLIGRGLDPGNLDVVSRIRLRGLDGRIHLLGERGDMECVMAGLDIVSLSSAYGEGFPNVLGEALSCGALCAATDVGDSAIVLGPYGRVVPPKHPERLAAAWLDLLSLDPRARADLQRRGREHVVEKFSLPVIGKAYEDLYVSLSARVPCDRVSG